MKTATTIDEYISGFPKDVQALLGKMRTTIRKAAPGAEEAIKYQIPTFVQNGKLLSFAGYKNHIGFYPGSTAVEVFQKELTAYEQSKGTVRFSLDKPLPLGLIDKITRSRVRANAAKAQSKAKAKRKV